MLLHRWGVTDGAGGGAFAACQSWHGLGVCACQVAVLCRSPPAVVPPWQIRVWVSSTAASRSSL